MCWFIVVPMIGCGVAPMQTSTWRLIWQGSGQQRYYVDTATVRVTGDSVEAIAWDFKPLVSRGLRGPTPSAKRMREAITIHCSTRTISGSSVANIESQNPIGGQTINSFGGTSNDGGPHEALAQLLCSKNLSQLRR